MNKSRRYLTGCLIFTCGLLATCLYFLFAPVVTQEGGVIYYLHQGAAKKTVLADLAQQGIVQHSLVFSLYIYCHKHDQLKAGEYLFPKGSSPVSIWRQITTGTGLLYHPFIIIPGWSFSQIRQSLNQKPDIKHSTMGLTDQQIMAQLGYPNLPAEGEFFPETYFYTKGLSDLVILKHAFFLMQNKLNMAFSQRAPNLPYQNAYQALIAASLIEKEAYLNAERPVIAGVMVNRLRSNMLLQIDATVIYGLGPRYTGKIYKENLRENTAYNTYVHKGLPPTPIAAPSADSIQAALHPEVNGFYYYVARGDGTHQFSKTLVEHETAISTVAKQQKQQKQHQSYFNNDKVGQAILAAVVQV